MLEVLDGRIAAAVVEIAHEGRAIDRREDRGVAADLHVALRVAGVLDVLLRGRLLDDRARETAREADAGALHIGAGLLPQLERLRLVAELDADFLQDGVGIALDDAEALFVQHRHQRNLADDIGVLDDRRLLAQGAPGVGTTARAAAGNRLAFHGVRRAVPHWT